MYALVASMVLLAATAPSADARQGAAGLQRARDGDIAIQEELDAARRAATIEAYDLFIARHPDHPLAGVASGERQRLIDRTNERRT
jgi:hypothetical protein